MKIEDIDLNETLKLKNQICFPLYAASRMVIRQYRPLLDKLGITYPQYLVLMVLWEYSEIGVKELGQKLHLDSGTLTPLLKRMESSNIVIRERHKEDERKVTIKITEKGLHLKEKAKSIPTALLMKYANCGEDLVALKELLYKLIDITEQLT